MSNSSRVTKVLVSNGTGANTGTTLATVVNNDVLLVGRNNVVIADTDTIANNANADVVRIMLGTGTASATSPSVKYSSPISVRDVRKVSVQAYEAPVQHKIEINGAVAVPATSAAGTAFNIKLFFHDTHRVHQDRDTQQFFHYTTLAANETAEVIFTALAAKINAVMSTNKQVSAAVSGTTTTAKLVITGLAVEDNAFGLPQFRYFDIALRTGFTATTGATTVTAGKPGRGTAELVKQLELAGMYDFNRISWPLGTDTRRATSGTTYSIVTIEHGTPHLSALHSTYVAPETTIIAFESGSAKQTALIEKLTSLIEGAGNAYVSDVDPMV